VSGNAGVDAILFDVDETLFDRRRAQKIVLTQMQQRLPYLLGHASTDKIAEAWAASDRATENHIFNDGDIRRARDARSKIFLQELGQVPQDETTALVTDAYLELYAVVDAPIDGAHRAVEACRQAFRIGVVSNAYPDVQYRKLETLGLRQAFSCVVLSEEFGKRKPDPTIFIEGCRLLQVEPTRCLYVGDSYANDVVGAAAAGLPCCWLNPTGAAAQGTATATFEVKHLDGLLAWFGLIST
jgi:putative hydrolase of the HAD superfamily